MWLISVGKVWICNLQSAALLYWIKRGFDVIKYIIITVRQFRYCYRIPMSFHTYLHSIFILVFAVHQYSLLFVGVVRASNIFPILSAILLLMGGVCIAASRFYKSKRNIILGAGILFVAAGNLHKNTYVHLCEDICAYMCVTACVSGGPENITCPNSFSAWSGSV